MITRNCWLTKDRLNNRIFVVILMFLTDCFTFPIPVFKISVMKLADMQNVSILFQKNLF